jgi:hypothetical protein
LEKYITQTRSDLRDHPLASRINSCESHDSVLDILQEQARIFEEFRKGDVELFKWLKPVINMLHAFSTNAVLIQC